jgi:hypothetical protein
LDGNAKVKKIIMAILFVLISSVSFADVATIPTNLSLRGLVDWTILHIASGTNPHPAPLTLNGTETPTLGYPSVKFSFKETGLDFPSHWLGSVCTSATADLFYFLGPRKSVPTTWTNYDGWAIRIASSTGSNHLMQLYMPNTTGTDWSSDDLIQIKEGEIDVGAKTITNITDGIAYSDACSFGQMESSVDAGQNIVVVAARSFASGTITIAHNASSTIVFSEENSDPSSSYDLNTGIFVAPTDGIYHFDCSVGLYNTASGVQHIWISPATGNTYEFERHFFNRKYISASETYNDIIPLTLSGDINLSAGEEFAIFCDWIANDGVSSIDINAYGTKLSIRRIYYE